MRCPFCGHEETQVKDSRPSEDNSSIRRRRQCPACAARFTTFERVQLRELMVIKKDELIFLACCSLLVRTIPPLGPLSVLWVVDVTTSAYSNGFGYIPVATNPAK